jgi:hypothetical protein
MANFDRLSEILTANPAISWSSAAVGSPSSATDPLELPVEAFIQLNNILKFKDEYVSFYFSRLFHCFYYFDYDGAADDSDFPTSLGLSHPFR